jgi:hypothetical protein
MKHCLISYVHPVVNQPGRKVELSPPASVEAQKIWVYKFTQLTFSWNSDKLLKHILVVKQPGRKAVHSPPASVEVQNMWVYTFNSLTFSWNSA